MASNLADLATVRCTIDVALPAERAFAFFTEHFALWWPRRYTWGREVVEDIGLEPLQGGLCYERGPHGFRSDWGRVLLWEPPHRLTLAWQISPTRVPEPNPAKASTVDVQFEAHTPALTRVVLDHRDFERHGDGAVDYRQALGSPEGWPWILERYASAASADGT